MTYLSPHFTLDELTLHEARCRQLLAVANKPAKPSKGP